MKKQEHIVDFPKFFIDSEQPSLRVCCRAHQWIRIPTGVTSANYLLTFRRLLKHFLFQQSYPDIICRHSQSVVLTVTAPLRPLL